jgi:hypothetical protein
MTKILAIGVQENVVISSDYDIVAIAESNYDFIFDREYAIVLIGSTNQSTFKYWVDKVRFDRINFHSLLYTTNNQFSDLAMVDDLLPDNLDDKINDYLRRKNEANLNTDDSLENKLLSYLWMSETRHLCASRIIDKGVNYKYPFLELWDQSTGKDLWLNRLARAGYLTHEKLINRIRQCASCQSSLLNYVDGCHDCGSIDLKVEQALHCFSCGHVGDQKEFIRSGEMVCPNCLNTLRHIGTDYDRPIENQRCNNCNNLFIDAKVSAQCFSCGDSNDVDDLVQKEYFSFTLAHNGIHKVKTGTDLKLLATAFGEPVTREHFYWMTNWLNRMAIRQGSHHLFISLKFVNLIALTQSLSIVDLTSQLAEFSGRLRNLLRTTDIFCQYSDDTLFFLLSDVAQNSVKIIEHKLATISTEQQENPLELSASLHLLPIHELSNDVDFWLTQRAHELTK